MRKIALLLGATTLGLALACAYLYRELQHERSRRPAIATEIRAHDDPVGPPIQQEIDPVDELPGAELAEAPERVAQSAERTTEARAAARAAQLAARREELQRRWADPAWRARALTREESQVRQANPDLGSALGLNATQESALVDLLARQALQIQEASEPMRFVSAAERQGMQQKVNALQQQHDQERAEFLGARIADYDQYRREVPERQQVRELRSRLDESIALSPTQSTQLVEVMYQERDSYLQQMKSVEDFGGYSLRYPIEAVSKSRDLTARARFAEQQLERTEQFMGRLRLRAQGILSADQLRRFDEIQEEQLAIAQTRVERLRNQADRDTRRRQRQ